MRAFGAATRILCEFLYRRSRDIFSCGPNAFAELLDQAVWAGLGLSATKAVI